VQLLTSRTVVFEPIILGSITESSSVF
jgi:hypothetical protein